ncbi:MAG: PAS domain S-box protein [Dehalococcoidia bacterium]|nr:PAS domain S-box protein [Dehalococcoidia bacterium]
MTVTFDLLEVLSECSDAMYAIDAEQKLVVWNKRDEEILSWTAEELLGRHCFDALSGHSDTQTCSAGCSVVLLASKRMVAPSHNILTKDKNGHQKWLSISNVLIPSDSRKLGAVVHIFRDSTEAIEASDTLHRLAHI